MRTPNLEIYRIWLAEENRQYPTASRPDSPKHFQFKTLWIPLYSGNRTATLDLNHDIRNWEDNQLWGANGNCDTPYVILEVPHTWTENTVNELARICCKRLNKQYGQGSELRVLKVDERMPVILDTIRQMNICRLAVAFSIILNKWLTIEQLKEVNRKNSYEYDSHTCASHDFCDANMAMDEAFLTVMGRDYVFHDDEKPETEAQNTEDTELMNIAWELARKLKFEPFDIATKSIYA